MIAPVKEARTLTKKSMELFWWGYIRQACASIAQSMFSGMAGALEQFRGRGARTFGRAMFGRIETRQRDCFTWQKLT
jgi:hypothetical protein